ncbi:MAG TPA: histidine kinase [Gaiellaceae bacterium]|nr:histidine kinase [Gaiellaceae bacterium]
MLDVALALSLLAGRLVALATGLQPGSGAVSYVTSFGLSLPFIWRRRHPVAVAVAVSISQIVEVSIGSFHNSVIALFAWLLVPYAVGAYAVSTRRIAAGFAVTATAGIGVAVYIGPRTFWNIVAVAGLLGGSLLAGLWVRQLRLRARTLENVAAQLERERDERARLAVAEERARIARELHDEVAHAMSVIAVQADAAEGALAHDPALVADPLVAIRDTARTALADMRRVVGLLGQEHARTPEPGLGRLPDLVEQARRSGLDVDVHVEGEPRSLPPAVDLAAYRVVQEGLTNVRKHAGASRADIHIRYGADAVAVDVIDDGDGSGVGGGGGRGLAGIRERVALLGGHFAAESRPRGFALCVTLPLA